MRLPRFRLRTLMIAVAVAGIASWVTRRIYEDDALIVLAVFMALPAAFLAACACLVIRYRNV